MTEFKPGDCFYAKKLGTNVVVDRYPDQRDPFYSPKTGEFFSLESLGGEEMLDPLVRHLHYELAVQRARNLVNAISAGWDCPDKANHRVGGAWREGYYDAMQVITEHLANVGRPENVPALY